MILWTRVFEEIEVLSSYVFVTRPNRYDFYDKRKARLRIIKTLLDVWRSKGFLFNTLLHYGPRHVLEIQRPRDFSNLKTVVAVLLQNVRVCSRPRLLEGVSGSPLFTCDEKDSVSGSFYKIKTVNVDSAMTAWAQVSVVATRYLKIFKKKKKKNRNFTSKTHEHCVLLRQRRILFITFLARG